VVVTPWQVWTCGRSRSITDPKAKKLVALVALETFLLAQENETLLDMKQLRGCLSCHFSAVAVAPWQIWKQKNYRNASMVPAKAKQKTSFRCASGCFMHWKKMYVAQWQI